MLVTRGSALRALVLTVVLCSSAPRGSCCATLLVQLERSSTQNALPSSCSFGTSCPYSCSFGTRGAALWAPMSIKQELKPSDGRGALCAGLLFLQNKSMDKGGPNCLYDSGVDTRFSCPMVKRGRVSNNYEFEVKYNCSGLIKFPLIQELWQCFPRFAPIGHFSRRELIGAQRAALVSRFAPIGTNWPFLLFRRNNSFSPEGRNGIKQETRRKN